MTCALNENADRKRSSFYFYHKACNYFCPPIEYSNRIEINIVRLLHSIYKYH